MIHVLRPDSVTPIQRYLDRAMAAGDSYNTQVEFACVLLYREREYRAMYSGSWRPDRLPGPEPNGPFAPFDLTPEAEVVISTAVRRLWGQATSADAPEDLFGLKQQACAGLVSVLRPVRRHAFGHLVAIRLARDLCRYHDVNDLAHRAELAHTELTSILALVYDAALLAPPARGGFDGVATATLVQRRARRHLTARRWRPDWHTRALERLDERIRVRAIDARTRVEGDAFTRFLTTELTYCEREQTAFLEGFDASVVPLPLRALIPIAHRFGVGDDVCRALMTQRMRAPERRDALAAIDASGPDIDKWLAFLGDPPYGREAACFFWLRQAADEMRDHGRGTT